MATSGIGRKPALCYAYHVAPFSVARSPNHCVEVTHSVISRSWQGSGYLHESLNKLRRGYVGANSRLRPNSKRLVCQLLILFKGHLLFHGPSGVPGLEPSTRYADP